MAQLVKNPPAMQEIWVRPLGWEDPLEKEMATHSSILAWRIPQMEDPLFPMQHANGLGGREKRLVGERKGRRE